MKTYRALLLAAAGLLAAPLSNAQVVLDSTTALGFYNVTNTYSAPISLTTVAAADSVVLVALTYFSNDAISSPIVFVALGSNVSLARLAFIGLDSGGTEINAEIWGAAVPSSAGVKTISLRSDSGPINGVGLRAFQLSNADFSTVQAASSSSSVGAVGALLGERTAGSFGLDILHSFGTGTYSSAGTTRTETVSGVDSGNTTVSSYVTGFAGGPMNLLYTTPTVNTAVAGLAIAPIPEPSTLLAMVVGLAGCALVLWRRKVE